jgi:predicted CoA-binding protein
MSDNFECELPRSYKTPDEIRAILESHRVIAVVGLSTNRDKPSYQVAAYMQSAGYQIVPVHPKADEILGERTYPDLLSIPQSIGVEIVDVFRRPSAVMIHAEEAIAIEAKVLWLQEGIVNNAAAEKAEAAGLTVVQSRCLLKEHRALGK